MPGVKGMKRSTPPPSAFKPGHTVQPTMEQRPTTIQRANRTRVAQRLREVVAQVEPADTLAWLYDAVELARGSGDAKALLQAVELVWLYGIGKPREQLSEREGIDMLGVIEAAAREMQERTIEGEAEERRAIEDNEDKIIDQDNRQE